MHAPLIYDGLMCRHSRLEIFDAIPFLLDALHCKPKGKIIKSWNYCRWRKASKRAAM
jgi:hypothetical protein